MARWTTQGVQVALSMDLVLDLFLHAAQGDRTRGGRFDSRYDDGGVAILIWPAPPRRWDRREVPQGEADFHWQTPFQGEVTLWRLGWDPDEGGGEELVWEALETLAGRSLRPGAP